MDSAREVGASGNMAERVEMKEKESHKGRRFEDLSRLLDRILSDIAGMKADMKKNDLLSRVEKLERGK